MDLSVIIVSWNTRELLKKCLKSIFEFTKDIQFEVFVVDNASRDGSAQMVKDEFPEVKLIASDKNLGFAKANNLALKQAAGKHILFMNPDMEIKENVFKKMINFMDLRQEAAVSTCKLIYPDGSIQPNIKRHPTFWSQALILLKLHHLFSFLPPIKKYLAKDFDYSKESEVEQIMGAFVFARRDFMKKTGGWDEDYFIWWEDVELCKRAAELGEKIIYFPEARVIHHEGKSFEQIRSVKKHMQFIKGMLTYFKKHHSFIDYFFLWALVPKSLFLAYVANLCKIKSRPQSRV